VIRARQSALVSQLTAPFDLTTDIIKEVASFVAFSNDEIDITKPEDRACHRTGSFGSVRVGALGATELRPVHGIVFHVLGVPYVYETQ
jgi:hypothetical protein